MKTQKGWLICGNMLSLYRGCGEPSICVPLVKTSLRPDFHVAAQICWVKKGGTFTGEVRMLQVTYNTVEVGNREVIKRKIGVEYACLSAEAKRPYIEETERQKEEYKLMKLRIGQEGFHEKMVKMQIGHN